MVWYFIDSDTLSSVIYHFVIMHVQRWEYFQSMSSPKSAITIVLRETLNIKIKIVTNLQHFKQLLGIFSLKMHRNGYVWVSNQNSDTAINLVTLISKKRRIFYQFKYNVMFLTVFLAHAQTWQYFYFQSDMSFTSFLAVTISYARREMAICKLPIKIRANTTIQFRQLNFPKERDIL